MSDYCPKRARSRWGYQLNAMFCCITGLLAAFTFQDHPRKPIANHGQSNLRGTSNVALDQSWPGFTLPARVPCLLPRVVLELLEMISWWSQIRLTSQLLWSQEPEDKRLKARYAQSSKDEASRYSLSHGSCVLTGNLAGTWNFKTTVLKRDPAKLIRLQCLKALLNKKGCLTYWDQMQLDFRWPPILGHVLTDRFHEESLHPLQGTNGQSSWSKCGLTVWPAKPAKTVFILSLTRRSISKETKMVPTRRFTFYNIFSLMDPISARHVPNHFHAAKKILGFCFCLAALLWQTQSLAYQQWNHSVHEKMLMCINFGHGCPSLKVNSNPNIKQLLSNKLHLDCFGGLGMVSSLSTSKQLNVVVDR